MYPRLCPISAQATDPSRLKTQDFQHIVVLAVRTYEVQLADFFVRNRGSHRYAERTEQ